MTQSKPLFGQLDDAGCLLLVGRISFHINTQYL